MLPKINQTIFLQVATSDEEEAKVEYKTKIGDINDDNLLIEVPIHPHTGKLKKLFLGDELSIYFLAEGGVKNYFHSHVVGFHEDVVRLVAIHRPDESTITKMQRRSFLRVDAELELAVQLPNKRRFLVHTDDVGGGGVSFLSDPRQPIQVSDTLGCWLLINFKNGQIDHAYFKGEVVRIQQLASGRNQVMLRYIEITDSDRQKVIRFCFERQLEYRNR